MNFWTGVFVGLVPGLAIGAAAAFSASRAHARLAQVLREMSTTWGAAGEPLLSGVVARSARRMVRSQLSALGDGVQVQVGQLVGAYLMTRHSEQRANVPASAPLGETRNTTGDPQ